MATHTHQKTGRGVLRGEMPASPDAGLNNNYNAADIAESFAARPVEELEFLAAQAEIELDRRSPHGIGAEEFRKAKRPARETSAEMAGRVIVRHERLLGALEEMFGDDADIRFVGPTATKRAQDYTEQSSHVAVRNSRFGRKVSMKVTSTAWVDTHLERKEVSHTVKLFQSWKPTVRISAGDTPEMIKAIALWAAQETAASLD